MSYNFDQYFFLISINFEIPKYQGYLVLLLEHQSTQDYKMPLRIQKYILRICEDHLTKNNNAKIPLIYPMLFYTGGGKYNAPLSFYSLFNNSELAKRFLTKPIQLIETKGFTKEDIMLD